MNIINGMNIESAFYRIDKITSEKRGIQAIIDGAAMSVPLDPDNRHYAEILRRVEAGTLVIQSADEVDNG